MISPFKSALGVNYKAFEARLESAIHVRFGLPPKNPVAIKTLIKKADKACAYFEATQLAGFTKKESLGFFGAPPADYDLVIDPLPAPVAQQRYLERYRVLAEAVGLVPAPDAWHTE
jgi:5'-deoxynucleotidase YfbR-like HD superfamily hydrolase